MTICQCASALQLPVPRRIGILLILRGHSTIEREPHLRYPSGVSLADFMLSLVFQTGFILHRCNVTQQSQHRRRRRGGQVRRTWRQQNANGFRFKLPSAHSLPPHAVCSIIAKRNTAPRDFGQHCPPPSDTTKKYMNRLRGPVRNSKLGKHRVSDMSGVPATLAVEHDSRVP